MTGERDSSVSHPEADASAPLPEGCTETPRPVDILLVTDTSGSMIEELETLADQIPDFLLGLANPPDRDGEPEWPPVRDIHVGVAPTGLSGSLATRGDPERGECRTSYSPFQSMSPGTDVTEVANAVSCVATNTYSRSDEALLGTMARALLPSDHPLHPPAGPNLGDTENRGFLRPGSILVVLFITDEDDETRCTLGDDPACDEECRVFPGPMTFCDGPGRLEAYVDALRSVRPPEDLLVGTLAGAAPAATSETEVFESFEGVRPTSFVCSDGLRRGQPAPRIARFTFDLGGEYRSICSETYAALTGAIAERVGARVCAP
ncbi:MAG: hypothetical protein JJ863_12280 [Deltaproteobacteria bacterium]|nr:hypothetical protein [Deltaproteobacteria bacterium]